MAEELNGKNLVLKEASTKLDNLLEKNAEALPEGFNKARFLQNCLTVLNDTEGIEKCDPVSIARTMIKGAYLGLDFFNREAYAIPYGGALQFQTDYKGKVKLIHKYSIRKIRDVYAKLVREGDTLEIKVVDGEQRVNFSPLNFNDGAILGAFAVAYFADGGMIYDSMSIKEIEQTRQKYSKIPNGPAWSKSPGEMYKKVVLGRLCKLVPLEFKSHVQDEAFNDGDDVDVKKDVVETTAAVVDPFADPKITVYSKGEEMARKVAMGNALEEKKAEKTQWEIESEAK